MEEAAQLWHFDPWWVLDDRRFRNHPGLAALKSTNVRGVRAEIDDLVYDRELGRIKRVSIHGETGRASQDWGADLLPESPGASDTGDEPAP